MFYPNHLHILVKGTCNRPPLEVEKLNDWFKCPRRMRRVEALHLVGFNEITF